ncbi:MAG: PQQ-binding-like beta-propeller repeat protein [Anaerolineae bacterium]|jgi:outer membrane protein assembly factor BamB|nr:PQQ-binding-like beta-propeller repeat protein [Anaerolineae bacterium]
MAGANSQRTSWTAEEVRGSLNPLWYRPFEPYIQPKVQLIAAHGLIYVSTAKGLYALDAENGNVAWVYPTELPLGHSPTVYGNRLYVGGFDRKIHCVEALTGRLVWTFEASGLAGGFHTNPLVLELDGSPTVFAGNRDGRMFALRDDGSKASQLWEFGTGGPILLSAAASRNGDTIYFASNDMYAYALNARTGNLVWKSAKLPAGGFHSWWPVVAGDAVIFPGSRPYRYMVRPQVNQQTELLTNEDPGYSTPMGNTLPDGTVDAEQAFQYFESKPWRRVYFVLDATTGKEITFDFDQDGRPEYAPFMKVGTHSGTVYPAVVDAAGTIYTFNNYGPDKYDQGPAGWQFGARSIIPTTSLTAPDEPLALSMGGDVIYWTQCCDRTAGAYAADTGARWTYFSYDLQNRCPGYDQMMMGTYEANAVQVYGGLNGVYGSHGDQNPPIPYRDKVYLHRGNTVIAWSANGRTSAPLSLAQSSPVETPTRSVSGSQLEERLRQEVEKIIGPCRAQQNWGDCHLRPGFGMHGAFAMHAMCRAGDYLADYFHSPVDTLYALSIAAAYLPSDLRQDLIAYLQYEYETYVDFVHVGWNDGAPRDAFDLPPEVEADNLGPLLWRQCEFPGWTGSDIRWVPHLFYALWKYAELLEEPQAARAIFDDNKSKLSPPPDDATLLALPHAHNAWIAGLWGYLELERLAGYPESQARRAQLERLLALRASDFEKDVWWGGPDSHDWQQALAVARNWMYLTPELGAYLRDRAWADVSEAFAEYEAIAPYWFVNWFEASYNENVIQPLYDVQGMFSAKAFVFAEPRDRLAAYLDVPAFARGDLFYIQNLVATIEAGTDLDFQASPFSGKQGSKITYTVQFASDGQTLTLNVVLPTGVSAPTSFDARGTDAVPAYNENLHRITWSDAPPAGQQITIQYEVIITTAEPQLLVHNAELVTSGGARIRATAAVVANPRHLALPLMFKYH